METSIQTAIDPQSQPMVEDWPQGTSSKVWLLTNAPSPYQAELLTAIATGDAVDLHVRYMRPGSGAGQAVSSDVPAVVMWGLAPSSWRDEFRLHPRALREAAFGDFDCYVLSGLYTSITFLCCAVLLTLRRKPWVVWLERPHPERKIDASWLPSVLMSSPARMVRRLLHWGLLKTSSRVLCIGTAAKDAYAERGAEDIKLDVLPYCCEVGRYDGVTAGEIEAVRQTYELHGKTVFLFSGQMIARKGVDTALAAFASLDANDAVLLLLGDGPEREALDASLVEGVKSRVWFLGHRPQPELPALFRAADVFVFPSRHDGWAVVINEACAAGLPILATRQTGAVHDLVAEGESGFLYERDDVDGFASGMQHFLDHAGDIETFGRRSRELVESWSPQRGTDVFSETIRRAIQRS